ncbi:carboxylesterase family protein [Mucilaginibacter myungsuensis]|uniref:carboxylesterase family protein n=1 Tax=Mucilaginibacter myungsuensis TaxID=649104 RepID=UPI001D1632A6|nr:alpha/beta hydrolase-fold protein [Mucilaginibacter myungsuensis]MDN3599533.1 alpha/beta hydrolase-fold protein [Mucilaginibacter myungsuensis]
MSITAIAQDVHHFTSGLTIRVTANYNRAAIYQDPVAYAMYKGTLGTPKEGDAIGSAKWTKITADTAKRFRARGGEGTYTYFTYDSPKDQAAVLNIQGNSAVFINGALHMGDPYRFGWMNAVVKLKKGKNDIFVRGGLLQGALMFPDKAVILDTKDMTAPFIVPGKSADKQKAAVLVINTTATQLANLKLQSNLGGKEVSSTLQTVPAYSTRKVYFEFDGSTVKAKGFNECALILTNGGKVLDKATIKIESALKDDKYSQTFISNIDGSLQYYSVAPQVGGQKDGEALFFSVHGAGVEAINQVRAYKSKDWGNLVSPTNRRPRGFNWEDWGRLDALEVLDIAKKEYKPDPQKVYLTGHSMGGHGTWFLGATYPDKWAAIAPCAGYPTLKTYGSADGVVPDTSSFDLGKVLLRTSNQSDVPKLINNYKQLGVYILHGDADETVSVNFARQMKQLLAPFHSDMNYYEYPGGSHWYSDESVDWKPIFDLFKWHKIPVVADVLNIDFTTASPGISAKDHWATIYQQQVPFQYSKVKLNKNKQSGTISGSTENVELLKLTLDGFAAGKEIKVTLDGAMALNYTTKGDKDSIFIKKENNSWKLIAQPAFTEKGPHRNGTFKDGFNKRMLYVYGTGGTEQEKQWAENKARYDAESWYYRGNGAFDIISDKEYSKAKYPGRNVVLIGNATTNSAWKTLLFDCPINITKGSAKIGGKQWTGTDIGAYFVWPIAGTADNSVSVISGTGIDGMNATNANQYFTGGSGFADIMLFKLDMLKDGAGHLLHAGFYDNQWKVGL